MNKPLASVAARIVTCVLVSAVVVASVACNKPPVGSCDHRPSGGNRCFDYGADDAASGKSICTGGKVWSDKPCDLTGSIGGCTTTGSITKWLYPGDKIKDRASAGAECTTWLEAARK